MDTKDKVEPILIDVEGLHDSFLSHIDPFEVEVSIPHVLTMRTKQNQCHDTRLRHSG
jgi:hypothetical protein